MGSVSQYERTTSNDDGLGHRYETKMMALTALRLYRNCDEFSVASNLAKGEKFDDIVYVTKTNGVPSTCLMQLKHKQVATLGTKKINLSALRTKDDFNLVKYFHSYLNIMDKFRPGNGDVIFGQPLSSVRFILFTNARLNYVKDGTRRTPIMMSTGSEAEANYVFTKESLNEVFPEKMSCVHDGTLDDFLTRFCFCTGQASEGDMDGLIRQEIELIAKDLSKKDIKYVVHELHDYIFYQCIKTGEYLTKERIQSILSRTAIETGFANKNESCLEFMPTFIKFVTNNFTSKIIALKSKADNPIMCKTLLAQIGLMQEPNLKISLQQLIPSEAKDHISNQWKSGSGIALVVDCEGDILGFNKATISSISSFFVQLSQLSDTNRVFLIMVVNNAVAVDIANLSKSRVLSFNCTLANLTAQSQKMLREKEVNFQGYQTKLLTLMPKGQEKILDDVFDMSSMTQLLQGRVVKVGLKPVESIPYYVTRMLIRQKTVPYTLFTDPSVKAQFALSGVTLEEAVTHYPLSSFVSTFQEVVGADIVTDKIIILSEEHDIEFAALSQKVRGGLHWFERKRGSTKGQKPWQWKMSKPGSRMRILNEYVNDDLEYVPTDNIMLIKEKLVVITAEPGMGKSTLLQHLAAETKKACPHIWVISLALNDYTEYFDRNDFKRNIQVNAKNLIAVAAGVDKEASKFDVRLFNQCYDSTGNMIVLLDGFDEITPYYTNEALLLIDVLKNSPISRVWVTARPQWRDLLEEKLSTLSYNIKPFSTKDQQNFLSKFWKQELSIVDEVKLKECVEKVMKLIMCFDAELDQFTGIPLQTRMIAEVFMEHVRAYHASDDILSLPERLNGVELFREFVNKKRGIQMQKAKITVTNASAKWEQRRLNEQREKELMSLALLSLLQRKVCQELDPPITDSHANELKKLVNDGNEKSGIVISFKSDQPQFIHRTFAEYFAALFFHKNMSSNKKFLGSDEFFEKSLSFVKYFLDRFLCGTSKLHEAVLDREVESVKEALKSGADVNARDEGGRTSLHLAAAFPDSEHIIQVLLQNGADAQLKDDILDWQPIEYAFRIKSAENIAPLLGYWEHPLPSDVVPVTWETMLRAVRGDYLKLFLYLLENGIYEIEAIDDLSPQAWLDDDVVYNGLTILHLAAAHNASSILKYLLNKKSRDSKARLIECADSKGNTPLVLAGARGCGNAIRVLVESGANALALSEDGKNLLQFAVEAQDMDVLSIAVKSARAQNVPAELFLSMAVTTLIAEKNERADWASTALQLLFSLYPNTCNMKTTKGVPVLQASVHRGNLFVVQLLCEMGANVNFMTANGPLLHYAVERGVEEIVVVLLGVPGLRINEQDAEGNTALDKAIHTSQPAMFEILLKAGGVFGNPDATVAGDILHRAIGKGDEEMVRTLLSNNTVGVNALDSDGHTPLYTAVTKNLPEIIDLLMNAGAKFGNDANVFTEQGPLLHLAVSNGLEDILMALLSEPQIDVNMRDANDHTALYVAAAKGQSVIFQRLVDAGADVKECSTKNGNDLTHAVAASCNEDIFFYLLENDLKFDRMNSEGQTGLSLLLSAGALTLANVLDPSIPLLDNNPPKKPEKAPQKKKKKKSTVDQPIPALMTVPLQQGEPKSKQPTPEMPNTDMAAPKTKVKQPKPRKKKPAPPLINKTTSHKEFDIDTMLAALKEIESGPSSENLSKESFESLRQKLASFKVSVEHPASKRKKKAAQKQGTAGNSINLPNTQSANKAKISQIASSNPKPPSLLTGPICPPPQQPTGGNKNKKNNEKAPPSLLIGPIYPPPQQSTGGNKNKKVKEKEPPSLLTGPTVLPPLQLLDTSIPPPPISRNPPNVPQAKVKNDLSKKNNLQASDNANRNTTRAPKPKNQQAQGGPQHLPKAKQQEKSIGSGGTQPEDGSGQPKSKPRPKPPKQKNQPQ